MTNDEGPFPPQTYLQFGIPNIPFSAARIYLSGDPERDQVDIKYAISMAEELAKNVAQAFVVQPAPRQEKSEPIVREPVMEEVSPGAQYVVVDGVPCCTRHKGRDGLPRTMKEWPERWSCSAKVGEGYCTNQMGKS